MLDPFTVLLGLVCGGALASAAHFLMRPSKSDAVLEVMLLRDKLKETQAELVHADEQVQKMIELVNQSAEHDRKRLAENARWFDLCEKMAGILGYTHLEHSLERLEKMPGIEDTPSLYLKPVVGEDNELLRVVPTNSLKESYVAWMHWPGGQHADQVRKAIDEERQKRATNMHGATAPQLAAEGMVPSEVSPP